MIDTLAIEETAQALRGFRDAAGKLAARYDRMMTAIDDEGIVEPAALRFASWLAGWWRIAGPPEPTRIPDAVSTSPTGIQLLRWYAVGADVRAYGPDGDGCYLIPAAYAEGGA
jgi:hypothetical protein